MYPSGVTNEGVPAGGFFNFYFIFVTAYLLRCLPLSLPDKKIEMKEMERGTRKAY